MKRTANSRPDVYTRVTNQIVADLENGVRPWTKTWTSNGAFTLPLRDNGQAYRGINVLLLWAASIENDYQSPHWMTFKQAKARGASVRKGETGHLVVFSSTVQKDDTSPESGESEDKSRYFMKGYTVFNAEQIDGLAEDAFGPAEKEHVPLTDDQRIEAADAFFQTIPARIFHKPDAMPCYVPRLDEVHMPNFENFHSPEDYYTTLAHELTHWTKAESRLDRDFNCKKWGDTGYATEELVAELGAAFLAAKLGISLTPREDHASYLATWLKALKNDKRVIFRAASHAQKAVDYLEGFSEAVRKAA